MPGREPERKPTEVPMADSKDATVTLPETTTMRAKYTTEEEEVYTASCIEVRIAEEVKYRTDGTPCSEGKWNGTCFQGQCVQTYLSRDRIEWDDDTGDGSLCPDYELSTTMDGAVTECAYSCVEGPAVYYVDVLNGMLCAESDHAKGLCIDGSCDISQPITLAQVYKPRPPKTRGELPVRRTTLGFSPSQDASPANNLPTAKPTGMTLNNEADGTLLTGSSTAQHRNTAADASEISVVNSGSSTTSNYLLTLAKSTRTSSEIEKAVYSTNMTRERGFTRELNASVHPISATTAVMLFASGMPLQERDPNKEKIKVTASVAATQQIYDTQITNSKVKSHSSHGGLASTLAYKSKEPHEPWPGNVLLTTKRYNAHPSIARNTASDGILGSTERNVERVGTSSKAGGSSLYSNYGGISAATLTAQAGRTDGMGPSSEFVHQMASTERASSTTLSTKEGTGQSGLWRTTPQREYDGQVGDTQEMRRPSRLPYVIFTDFFHKFAMTEVPAWAGTPSKVKQANATRQQFRKR